MAEDPFNKDATRAGYKPPVGINADPFSHPIYQYDENGTIVDKRDFGGTAIEKTKEVRTSDPEKARVGDYYYDGNGNLNVVPNSPTDIFYKYKLTGDATLSAKPEKNIDMFPIASGLISSGFGALGSATGAAIAAKTGATAAAGGAVAGAAMAGLPVLALLNVVNANQVMAQEKAYKKALADWQKSQQDAVWDLAGSIETDDEGNVWFKKDLSKAIGTNNAFAGSEVQEALKRQTEVSLGDDGRLKIKVNPVYAATDEYKEQLDKISQAYAGLTKDSEDFDESIENIRQYIDNGNNQFNFRESSLYAYKQQLPDASYDAIEDAYNNELGAYMSESDGGDFEVKVYRDGNIETKTAKEVLENVYNKDLGQRSDYMLDLFSKMEDPDIPDDDKVYILSEIRMLNAADSNEQTYENGQKDDNGVETKSRNKYFGMLDQESIISWLNNFSLLGNVTFIDVVNAVDKITPWDMHTSKQEGLQEDPAAATAAKLISTATSAYLSALAMQGIEYKIVRPLAGKAGSALNSTLENLAAKGGTISDFVGKVQLTSGAIGEKISTLINGSKIAAGPLIKGLGYSMGELLFNATSDLVFDAGKQGVLAMAGENPTAEDFLNEYGTDLVMDIILQYGPAGLAQMRTEMDNFKVEEAYAPFKGKIETAKAAFDSADLDFQTLKNEISEMRKGTKKYAAKEAELKKSEKTLKKARTTYESLRKEATEAIQKAMPTMSEEIGATIAGKMAKAEENNIIMWLRKKLTDDKAALDTLAKQAYNKTSDVHIYMAAVNKFQNIQAGIKEVSVKLLSDVYAKGTKRAYVDFANSYAKVSHGFRLTKGQIEYLVAKTEYDNWMAKAGKDADVKKAIEEKYSPYINKIQGEEATQLNELLSNIKTFLQKVGESYVKSGAATKEQIKNIEKAALGDYYIPLWGKGSKASKVGVFETPLTKRVGREYDPEQGMYDVENIQNPVQSAVAYSNNVINNIARNEMAAMLKEVASIEGLGVELVGEGVGKPEYQDKIDEAIKKVAEREESLTQITLKPETYEQRLNKALDKAGREDLTKGIDSMISRQKKLRKLIALNRTEQDPFIKARRASQITNLRNKLKVQQVETKQSIDNYLRAAANHFNKTYSKYGLEVDADGYLSSKLYTRIIDGNLNKMSEQSLLTLKDSVNKMVNKIAPYLPVKKMNEKMVSRVAQGLASEVRADLKKKHPEYSKAKIEKVARGVMRDFRAQLSGDYSKVTGADFEGSLAGAYKIPFVANGQDASFYIKGDLAKEVAAEMTTKNVNDRRKFVEFAKDAANIKRLLTTGIDPTRVLPNLVRDTLRNGVFSGGTDYWFYDDSPFGFVQMFTKMARAMGDSDEQIAKALEVMRMSQEVASGATYNEAFHSGNANIGKKLVEASDALGDNRGLRFVWELGHDKRKLLEAPMNWAEGLTRNRAASSAFMRSYMRGGAGLDQEIRLKNAYESGVNAARENTVNFIRRGEFIQELSSFVPYLSQRFSSIESTKIAFLKDPVGVSMRIMMLGAVYMMELSRTLANEKSRKSYYNLSEYDRDNNIILSLGEGDLVTIPLDETLAAFIYPWRRGIETMHNVDPEEFYKIMIDGFIELSPFDLSGFTEGDSFNFGRGVEKLGAQVLPTLVQAAYTQATGRNMYFGSSVEVTEEDLNEYGIYNPTPGDYTTLSKNSNLLRGVANALGVEQWRLQTTVSDLGGNVGQYVVNWLDRIANAPEDAQGGKDFVDATFKSFTGMDSEQVKYAFNDGIAQLQQEKEKIKSTLVNLNKQMSVASGKRLAELHKEYQKAKQNFSMKVGSFVDKYINAYEIAGGLTKAQANKIWYLFNFSDDDSISEQGSVEGYYRDLAKKQANQLATKNSASILDKYYDQTKNVYRDSNGTWRYYSPYGEQAFFNTVQGKGMEYQVGLRNLVEGSTSNLSNERSAAYDARTAAAKAKNWDEYDRIGLDFDTKVLEAISPYVEKYGADNVLTNSTVLDYLEEWFFVPSSYMKTKYGKNVSLANNASKQRAFVRPYIKSLFNLNTGYNESNYVSRPDNLVRGEK